MRLSAPWNGWWRTNGYSESEPSVPPCQSKQCVPPCLSEDGANRDGSLTSHCLAIDSHRTADIQSTIWAAAQMSRVFVPPERCRLCGSATLKERGRKRGKSR